MTAAVPELHGDKAGSVSGHRARQSVTSYRADRENTINITSDMADTAEVRDDLSHYILYRLFLFYLSLCRIHSWVITVF